MAKPATGIADDEVEKYNAEQKKQKDEAEKKWREDREKERAAAVEHGSILDEDMAEALDKQDEREKEILEEEAEAIKAGRDMSQHHQAGNVREERRKS